MAHAQKPDFVFRRNGRGHLNRRGASVQSTAGSRGVRISGSNVGYTMFRGRVKGTGYPLHSPASPSLTPRASPCAIIFQLDSNKTWDSTLFFACFTNTILIQGVPLATESGISLISVTPMKILQRNLNRSTFVVWEMKRNVSVVCLIVATR